MTDKDVAVLNKILWVETTIKEINHERAPQWVKDKCNDALDNIVSAKCMLLSKEQDDQQ